MQTYERALVGIDQGVWAGLWRVVVGFALVHVWQAVGPGRAADWSFVPFFIGVLVVLRVAPAVLRKLLPTTKGAREVWAARRQLSKQYDSYQWQKLFWIGCGLLLHMGSPERRFPALVAVMSACLVTGAIGIATWHRRSRQLESSRSSLSLPERRIDTSYVRSELPRD